MFQLLYPLGLLAAIGILIPVIIHLWNIKSGRTLKIGSVFLLGTPSNQRSRSFKVNDWPLLLLRALLILLVAFIMAAPVYQKLLKTTGKPGWILVEKASFPKVWKQQHQLLDSLVKKGYEVHDFNVQFEKIDLKDTLTTFSRPSRSRISTFSLIKALDNQHPAGTNLYIFTANTFADFDGKKPITHLNLHWSALPKDNIKTSWHASAYQMNNGQVKMITAQSDSMGVYYTSKEVSKSKSSDIKADTSNILVQLFADKNAVDASYLSSAVLAIADYTERKIKFQRISSSQKVNVDAALVFWLSEKELSAADNKRLGKAAAIFTYAGSKAQKVNTTVQDLSGVALESAIIQRRTLGVDTTTTPLWLDGSGMPILTKREEKGLIHYQFYSRFRADWTNLVWSDEMILFLMPIILPESSADTGFKDKDKLTVELEDLSLTKVSQASNNQLQKFEEQSISPWLWWILLLLFILERWISYRKKVITS
jgi:hypothetical protein